LSDQLLITEQPDLDDALMLAAWSGWSDAGESATRALHHLTQKLSTTKFAEIDAEDFYIFTEERPLVENAPEGGRRLIWPKNEFYYLKSESEELPDIVFLIGTEPHLRWRNYTSLVADVANAMNVNMLVTVGALLDEVPHTRSAVVMSTTIHENLGPRYRHANYSRPNYEGPSGMTSATMDAFARRNIMSASIWGHAPRYLQGAQNPSITLAIIEEIQRFANIEVPTSDLEREAEDFTARVDYALENTPKAVEYVRNLEERYDSEMEVAGDPEPAAWIDEIDEFLLTRNSDEDDEPKSAR
jgi:proteasome assembly chaperone (PAC2) family protein